MCTVLENATKWSVILGFQCALNSQVRTFLVKDPLCGGFTVRTMGEPMQARASQRCIKHGQVVNPNCAFQIGSQRMRFLPHIKLASKENSLRRIVRILQMRSILNGRLQITMLPDFLKPNCRARPSLSYEGDTHNFRDAARIHNADGDFYVFPDDKTVDCRTRK